MQAVNLIKGQAKLFVWLIILLQLTTAQVSAQKYFFDNYSVKQGLAEQKVYKLLQDSKDYIWLGTANGLSRFDGKKFDNYTVRNGLSAKGVISIIEDSLGYIWFGHIGGGISRYNGQTFEQASFDSLLITGDITNIVLKDDKMWFTSAGSGAIEVSFPVMDIKHIKGKQYMGKEGLSDRVFGSYLKKDSSLICIADVGLRKFNPEEKRFENYRMPHMTTYFSTSCLLEDSKGNMWFGTYNGGLYKYVMGESRMEMIDLPKLGISSNFVYCLREDSKGRIWAGTFGGGIALIDGANIRKFDDSDGLKASKIYDIIEDAEGNILIADQNNGLTIFKGDAFQTYNDSGLFPDLNVNAIHKDNTGSIWFGTSSGITRYSPGKKPVFYNSGNKLFYDDIRFLKEDKEGNIWIGANEGGVIVYNPHKASFEPQPYINSIIQALGQSLPMVRAMEIDRQNNLWIGTDDGVVKGTIGEENFQRLNSIDSLIVPKVTSLYCDPQGIVWIGTEGKKSGLIRYNPKMNEFNWIGAFKGIFPKTMVMDQKNILWVGTAQGLISFKNDTLLTTMTQDEGLLSNNINLLTTDVEGSIYIGTNRGLNRYFPESGRIFSYTERNGFTGIETKPNAFLREPTGDIWFGTSNGVIRLTPSKLSTAVPQPLTHMVSMQVNYHNRKMIPGLKLNFHDANPVLFDYHSICLSNPDVVRYKVRLDGADLDWQPVTEQTRAVFPALPPGKYTFNVIASNSQGVWNSTPVSFQFFIRPPFYRTWWFLLTLFIVLVVAVVMYIKVREKNLRKEKIILEEKVEERTAEVVQKSMEIEEKNRDITASIRYAERIQRAMLPKEDTFKETFVLFMPKDIVSGDFYWMYDNGDWQFIAVVDCTGHGVPGAFMSIIGHNSLNKIVREYGYTRPSAIMDQLNIEVMKALLQRHEKAITDGMDIALIAFNRKQFTLEFAGAFNPLYHVRKGEVTIHKGDRFPIGWTSSDEKKKFTNNIIDIRPGDMLYMCSDGYADQFGSSEVKKYKSANVKKLLAGIWDLPICTQKDRLEKEILDWKGDLDQVDDILFIGTKIPEN